jgi:hypothetical protein
MLDVMESRVILPVEMSVEDHHRFVVCAMAGFECQPVFTPATPVVAAVVTAISSPTRTSNDL